MVSRGLQMKYEQYFDKNNNECKDDFYSKNLKQYIDFICLGKIKRKKLTIGNRTIKSEIMLHKEVLFKGFLMKDFKDMFGKINIKNSSFFTFLTFFRNFSVILQFFLDF